MPSEPMIIFTRTYDLVTWLMPHTLKFPRGYRFAVTGRLQGAVLDFQERIIEANHLRGRDRLARLRQADMALDKVRLYLRLAFRWEWLSEGQYFHASQMVKEVGELLGGWIRQTIEALGPPKPPAPAAKPAGPAGKPDTGTSSPK